MALNPEVLASAGDSRPNSDTGLLQRMVAGAINSPNLFQPVIATVESWLATLDVIYAGGLLFPGTDGKVAIIKHPTALQKALLTGRRLIRG